MAKDRRLDAAKAKRLSKYDATIDELAASFEVEPERIQEEIESNAKFAESIAIGRKLGELELKRKAHEFAMAGDKHVLVFLLKARCGYRGAGKVELPKANGNPLDRFKGKGKIIRIEAG